MTKTDDDIYFEIDFADGNGYRRISPDALNHIPQVLNEELDREMLLAAEQLEAKIRFIYGKRIREKNRGEGEKLRDRVFRAIKHHIDMTGESIGLGVFDVDQVRRDTSTPEDRVSRFSRSLFDMMEEGYSASKAYGFLPLDYAVELAQSAATRFEYSPTATARFLEYVKQKFAGKHGEGIMVEVFQPLFWTCEEFGDPIDYGIVPHSAWEGWHVLDTVRLPGDPSGEHWAMILVEKAMANATRKLQTMSGG